MGWLARLQAAARQVLPPCAMVVYIALGLLTERWLIGYRPLPATFMQDFGDYARAFFDAIDGRDPYTIQEIGPAFIYPTPALFVVGPFALIPWPLVRGLVYDVCSLIMLVVMTLGVGRLFGLPFRRVWWWLPLVCFFAPMLELLHIGQINVFTAFGIFLMVAFGRRRPALAGFGLSMAICTKVTPLVLLGYLALARQGKAVIATVLWLVVEVVAAGLLFGWRSLVVYVDVFQGMTRTFLPGDVNTQALVSVLNEHHVLTIGQLGTAQHWLILYLGIITLISAALSYRSREYEPFFVVIVLAMTLAPNILWYHHYVFALLPLLVWMARARLRWPIVAWCCLVLTVIQIDRWLTHGLLAQAALQATVLVAVGGQAAAAMGGVERLRRLVRPAGYVSTAPDVGASAVAPTLSREDGARAFVAPR